MLKIVSQEEEKVKCGLEECQEDVFRGGLCFEHFIEAETAAWDDWDAEVMQAHLVSAGRG